jgi:hypothetical protein
MIIFVKNLKFNKMEAVLNSKKVALTLSLNAVNVQDFLNLIQLLKFPVKVENKVEQKETPLELLYRFSTESPEFPMPEDEMMDLINAEINAYREEKMVEFEKLQSIKND